MIYLGLGTNLGDRQENLRRAREQLEPQVHVIAASPVYETPPWGYLDQPSFLNQVLQVETDLPPHDLLVYLKNLEVNMGRQPNFRYGPRLIDIDILLYHDLELSEDDLTIPHAHLTGRTFVLIPLADLAPELVVQGKTVREWVEEVEGEDYISKIP